MKQIQFNYESDDQLLKQLKKISQWCQTNITSKVLFQIYAETFNRHKVEEICQLIEQQIPDAVYMGCSSGGNIVMGEYNGIPIAVICTIFEYPTTKIEIFQYSLKDDGQENEVTSQLLSEVRGRSWVKSVMINAAIVGLSMTKFCEDLSELPEGIELFGGVAFSKNDEEAFVFSSSGQIADHSVVFALIGGADYYVKTGYVTGWRPLGKELNVTRAVGNRLYELDGRPAYDTYYRYLRIQNDENFFEHALEFPFYYEYKNSKILRAPTASNEDGSLTLTADMKENIKTKLAYGDPRTILESVYEGVKEFREFAPEMFTAFSCTARRSFWGSDIGKETVPFQTLAQISGFYTLGELLRIGKNVIQHNVTLVIGAHREGLPDRKDIPEIDPRIMDFSGKISLITRLSSFVQVATEELEEANEQLRRASITDSMTELLNRGEIQKRIFDRADQLEQRRETDGKNSDDKTGTSLVMIDIDHFKRVNDTYGHKEGDDVIKRLAKMLKEIVEREALGSSIGRWGGEEFMVLLPKADVRQAAELAELFRKSFSEIQFAEAGQITISLGVTEMAYTDGADKVCTRVDHALYEAKNTGRNRVVVY